MDKRFLGYDDFTGLMSFHHYDALTDESHIETIQTEHQLNKELEATKELKSDEQYTREGMKNDMLHYGHVPSGVLMEWYAQGVDIKSTKELMRMINKPEYAYLKTTTMVHK